MRWRIGDDDVTNDHDYSRGPAPRPEGDSMTARERCTLKITVRDQEPG